MKKTYNGKMLNYNDIKPKRFIVLRDEPYEVLSSQTKKKNRQKPANQTKLKNLLTGSVIEKAFHQSDKVEEADIETKRVIYLYNNKGSWWFCEKDNHKERFELGGGVLGDASIYLKENATVDALTFKGEIIGIKIPVKVDLEVKDAPPAVRGNTASGATKQVTLETGVTISAPLFVEEGDIVRVNTETGLYSERVEKG